MSLIFSIFCIFVKRLVVFAFFLLLGIYECHLVPTFLPLRSISAEERSQQPVPWADTTCSNHRLNQWEASKTDQSHVSVSAPTYCYISSSQRVLSLLRKNLMSHGGLFNLGVEVSANARVFSFFAGILYAPHLFWNADPLVSSTSKGPFKTSV